MAPQTFIFVGPSGCGKGTQVDLLKAYLREKTPLIPQFSSYTGERFRAFINGETLASKRAKEIQDAGGLQPEFIAVYLWADNLIRNLTGEEHLFIDGSPRKIAEAMVLDSALQFFRREPVHLILVNVSDAEARRRLLLRGRHDDSEEDITRRLGWYTAEVVPAVEYLKKLPRYRFHDINGERTSAEVHQTIVNAIGEE